MADRNPFESEGRPACRRLWPSDHEAIRAHFARLDPETRASRFMAAVSDRVVLAYAERSFAKAGLMYGVFVGGMLRGLGELRPEGRRSLGRELSPRAEAAFSVERAVRRRGIGSILFRRIVGAARNRGVAELHVRCLHENTPMRLLAVKLGAELQLSGPEMDGTLRLDRPTPYSLWREGVAELLDLTLANAARGAKTGR